MNHVDQQYNDLITTIRDKGVDKDNRTGIETRSIFGHQMCFDISNGQLPLLTTKKVFSRIVIHELLWMLSGDDDVQYLKDNNVGIWDSWVDPNTARYNEEGELVGGRCPKVYGVQWRHWNDCRVVPSVDVINKKAQGFDATPLPGDTHHLVSRKIDQVAKLVDGLKNNPDSRRLILTAWNPAEVDEMALAPCHGPAQFWTRKLSLEERQTLYSQKYFNIPPTEERVNVKEHILDKHGTPTRALSCHLTMRSNDVAIGNPFNIVQYALLTHLLAHVTNMSTDQLVYSGGDCHVYENQWSALGEQMEREGLEHNGAILKLNHNITDIDDFTFDDIAITGYQSEAVVKFPPAAV